MTGSTDRQSGAGTGASPSTSSPLVWRSQRVRATVASGTSAGNRAVSCSRSRVPSACGRRSRTRAPPADPAAPVAHPEVNLHAQPVGHLEHAQVVDQPWAQREPVVRVATKSCERRDTHTPSGMGDRAMYAHSGFGQKYTEGPYRPETAAHRAHGRGTPDGGERAGAVELLVRDVRTLAHRARRRRPRPRPASRTRDTPGTRQRTGGSLGTVRFDRQLVSRSPSVPSKSLKHP